MPTRDTVMILTEEFDPHADIMIALLQERAPGIEVFRFHSDMFPEATGLEAFIGDDGYSAHNFTTGGLTLAVSGAFG